MVASIGQYIGNLSTSITRCVSDLINKISYVAKLVFLGLPAIALYSINHLFCTTAFVIGLVKPHETQFVMTKLSETINKDRFAAIAFISLAVLTAPHFGLLSASVIYCSYIGARISLS